MTNNQQKGGGTEVAVSGIIGMAVGAAAATIILSDKITRKRLEKKVDELKTKGREKLEEIKKTAKMKKEEVIGIVEKNKPETEMEAEKKQPNMPEILKH